MSSIQTIQVHTAPAYEVSIGGGLLHTCGPLLRESLGLCHVAVITDSNVAPLYLGTVTSSLQTAGFAVSSYVFPAGEARKNFDTLSGILEFLAEETAAISSLPSWLTIKVSMSPREKVMRFCRMTGRDSFHSFL